MVWAYILVFGTGLLLGFILAAIFATKERDEKQEEEEFYKAMRELNEKKERKNAEHKNK